ncbi:hypothetical protein [Streptomyces sp. NPDC086989]|uniref:hypothetical protein n=1 Tax=Streptomyces sp. NPDC086989 TaxID=3365764 RepID=UPI00381B0F82
MRLRSRVDDLLEEGPVRGEGDVVLVTRVRRGLTSWAARTSRRPARSAATPDAYGGSLRRSGRPVASTHHADIESGTAAIGESSRSGASHLRCGRTWR